MSTILFFLVLIILSKAYTRPNPNLNRNNYDLRGG
ncbi:hypothetical protein SRABI134_01964 [Peribacillus sp. Bi134]|jgi:hypothetical protein|nr:hypothetical protein SRABI134_01964 [Peribacillus sp. Bi134]